MLVSNAESARRRAVVVGVPLDMQTVALRRERGRRAVSAVATDQGRRLVGSVVQRNEVTTTVRARNAVRDLESQELDLHVQKKSRLVINDFW